MSRIVHFTQGGVPLATRASRIDHVRPPLQLGPSFPKESWCRAEVIIHGCSTQVDQDTTEAIRRWETAENGFFATLGAMSVRWLTSKARPREETA